MARVEFLGWTDSGMAGDATNDAPYCFWQADVDHAAARLAVILAEEQPEILTVYDDIGGYGHPDHVQVHRVGIRAGALAGVPIVAQGAINRDRIDEAMSLAAELGVDTDDATAARTERKVAGEEALDEVRPPTAAGDAGSEAAAPAEEPAPFGKRQAELTHRVDVSDFLEHKRASMQAHASQIGPDHFMLSMPDLAFAFVFGDEWFIVDDVPADPPALFSELFEPNPG